MVWRQAAVFADAYRSRPEVRGRNSQEFRGLDRAAAGDDATSSPQGARSQAAASAPRVRRSEAADGRTTGEVACGAGRSAVAGMADQGYGKRPTGLARQAGAGLREGRTGIARRALPPACLLPSCDG